MEPCLYRQGEGPSGECAPEDPGEPQWSPAFIGRERRGRTGRQAPGGRSRNGALPLSAGREVGSTEVAGQVVRGRNGALPLSAGRGRRRDRGVRDATRAAMEPCLYRQGERPYLHTQ